VQKSKRRILQIKNAVPKQEFLTGTSIAVGVWWSKICCYEWKYTCANVQGDR